MKKLNNKGFAVSTILYGILSLVIIILMLIFGVMKASKDMNESLIDSLTESMNACVSAEYKLENCYFSGEENCSSFLTEYEECSQYGDMIDRTLRGQILADNEIYDDNVSSKYVSNANGIDFSLPSSETNGIGLYKTGDLTKTEDINGDGIGEAVYYFRGTVENNYVKLGMYPAGTTLFTSDWDNVPTKTYEKEEPLYWRIVRINEDGSVRLIYDGPYEETINAIHDRDYDNSAKYVDSDIEDYLDTWYNDYLKKYDDLIALSSFCNDIGGYDKNGNRLDYSETAVRLGVAKGWEANGTPQFKCSKTIDLSDYSDYNGYLLIEDLSIGLLTADELYYAGKDVSYLYSDYKFWTMTTYKYGYNSSGYKRPYMFLGTSGNSIADADGTIDFETYRPVINIKSDVKVVSAKSDGTKDNPYILVTEN